MPMQVSSQHSLMKDGLRTNQSLTPPPMSYSNGRVFTRRSSRNALLRILVLKISCCKPRRNSNRFFSRRIGTDSKISSKRVQVNTQMLTSFNTMKATTKVYKMSTLKTKFSQYKLNQDELMPPKETRATRN